MLVRLWSPRGMSFLFFDGKLVHDKKKAFASVESTREINEVEEEE